MNFVVIGAGAWGTAFAVHLARTGHPVTLAPRRAEHAVELARSHENIDYLPGISLPDNLKISADLRTSLQDAEVVLLACPAQALRETCVRIRDNTSQHIRIGLVLSLVKGLELSSHKRPSEVIAEVLPGLPVGSLTGPTNAEEVAGRLPAAMVMASRQPQATLQSIQAALSSPMLRVYTSEDLAGAELGGCLKNIYAIAAGCCDGG